MEFVVIIQNMFLNISKSLNLCVVITKLRINNRILIDICYFGQN